MDFGDATFTSFEASNSWITAFAVFPQVDPLTPSPGWFIGKIHSHHSMAVFHSATDKTDLHNTAPNLPMFLSLIVNYNTQTDCELAIEIEAEEKVITEISWKLKGWREKIVESKTDVPTAKRVYVMKCQVYYEQDEWFVKEITALQEKNKPKAYSYTPPVHNYGKPSNGYEYDRNKYLGQGTTTGKKGRKKNRKGKVVHSADIKAALNGTTQEYTYKTYQTVLKELPDLLTLGLGHTLTPYDALKKVDLDLTVNNSGAYQKAFVYYFIEQWYPVNFCFNPTYVDADEIEVVRAIQNFMSHHKTLWIETIISKALKNIEVILEEIADELEEEEPVVDTKAEVVTTPTDDYEYEASHYN